MGMVEVARDALKDIPISEVLRERVSIALDRLEETERQIATVLAEKGGLQAQLERERIDNEQAKKELQQLQELHREEIRLVCDVEFRKGVRTSGKWMPFCPKCHLPLAFPQNPVQPTCCGDCDCGWVSNTSSHSLQWESHALASRTNF
jgi:RNase P subunit RPR2